MAIFEPNQNSDNTYYFSCNHVDNPCVDKREERRINSIVDIPKYCPLEDYIKPQSDNLYPNF